MCIDNNLAKNICMGFHLHNNLQMLKKYPDYRIICLDKLTYIHKSEDQVLVDKFCAETRAAMRESAHQETAQPQMINCFCMYSDYTPLTLEEWVECDQRRRDKADCG